MNLFPCTTILWDFAGPRLYDDGSGYAQTAHDGTKLIQATAKLFRGKATIELKFQCTSDSQTLRDWLVYDVVPKVSGSHRGWYSIDHQHKPYPLVTYEIPIPMKNGKSFLSSTMPLFLKLFDALKVGVDQLHLPILHISREDWMEDGNRCYGDLCWERFMESQGRHPWRI